ncbi:hypothetical protein OUZ56_021388 [Daphnia magna]|uniref:Uncharacterized protein n=1 Tax=Daphnia magna TaxID=35525 RepID=A0ABQ9ZH91_9CRUS|nr:hypothetical protein OUZ56_021388 [Daphnia magna]
MDAILQRMGIINGTWAKVSLSIRLYKMPDVLLMMIMSGISGDDQSLRNINTAICSLVHSIRKVLRIWGVLNCSLNEANIYDSSSKGLLCLFPIVMINDCEDTMNSGSRVGIDLWIQTSTGINVAFGLGPPAAITVASTFDAASTAASSFGFGLSAAGLVFGAVQQRQLPLCHYFWPRSTSAASPFSLDVSTAPAPSFG